MRALRPALQAVLIFLLLACGEPVREDRTITWSGDGNGVGFQHGDDGVYVARRDGGGLERIHEPGEGVVATSPPRWAPTGDRLLFSTAEPDERVESPTLSLLFGGVPDPAGRLLADVPAAYTCWLREGEESPRPLFRVEEASVGYVAADLAVRWLPDGSGVLHVRPFGKGRFGLFSFDLESGEVRRVFPHAADGLVFETTPDGRLACVLGTREQASPSDGVWIGRVGETDWWHVPGTEDFDFEGRTSLLEDLRARRPAFTPDGRRFAFVTSAREGEGEDVRVEHAVGLGTGEGRRTSTLVRGEAPFRDLRWAPDGERLGVVRGEILGTLQILRVDGTADETIREERVRRFAGWSRSGSRLAYVVPETPAAENGSWALLLLRDRLARDTVVMRDAEGGRREVVTGIRATFPTWSPDREELSVWFTFTPSHRSLLAMMLGTGLRPGDPAAVLDAETGEIAWMAIDGHEMDQVGHLHLLGGRPEEAWSWYEKARVATPLVPPRTHREWLDVTLGRRPGPDRLGFRAACLSRLGRDEEAQAEWARFRRAIRTPPPGDEDRGLTINLFRALLEPEGALTSLLVDLRIAEIFLSVDAGDLAEAHFRRALAAAAGADARFSAAVALGQTLLLDGRHGDYARLATGTMAPRLLARPAVAEDATPGDMAEWGVQVAGVVALLPLFSPEFLGTLDAETREALPARWEALRASAKTPEGRRLADLALHAVYAKLGRTEEAEAARARMREEVALGLIDDETDVDGIVEELRQWAAIAGR